MSTKRSIIRQMLRGRFSIPKHMIKEAAKVLHLSVVVTPQECPWTKSIKLHQRQRRRSMRVVKRKV